MTPVLAPIRRVSPNPSLELRAVAGIVLDAASSLATEGSEARDASRFQMVVDRISAVLDSPEPSRAQILRVSPALTESSGRYRTLIEMVESEPGDDAHRLRMAKLLLRALVWRPETLNGGRQG